MTAFRVSPGTVPVRAVFGPTIQGEGPMVGRLSAFIRFGGCNLHCPPCDTKDTWDRDTFPLKQLLAWNPPLTAAQVLAQLATLADTVPPLVVLTGGEPLLHQRTTVFEEIVAGIPASSTVQVETNGTIAAAEQARELLYVVSPKICGSMAAGDPAARRIKTHAIDGFAALAKAGRAWFKFVCSSVDDVGACAGFCATYGIDIARSAYIMPEGSTLDRATATHRRIMPAVLRFGFNTTGRLHLSLDVP